MSAQGTNPQRDPPHSGEESPPPSTQRLVDSARRGDIAAFEELYARTQEDLSRFLHRHSLMSTIRQLTGNEVEDICSKVQLRILEALRKSEAFRLRHAGHFSAWVRRVAVNVLLDLRERAETFKRGGGHTPSSLDTQAIRKAAGIPGGAKPMGPLSRARYKDLVERLLDLVPPSQREIAWLVWVMGLSKADVARRLGKSSVRVRNIMMEINKLVAPFFHGDVHGDVDETTSSEAAREHPKSTSEDGRRRPAPEHE